MAEQVRGMPKHVRARQMSESAANRLLRRKMAINTLRKQAEIATERLTYDIFNVWRTGEASMETIAKTCGYSLTWVSQLITKIRKDEQLLQKAIDAWMEDNPNKELS
jgi:hypothetical protein